MSAECRVCGHDVFGGEPCVWCATQRMLRDVTGQLSATRDALDACEAELRHAKQERDRAIETRENANAATLRAERERDRYRDALRYIAHSQTADPVTESVAVDALDLAQPWETP